jgi:hypothetical protein
LNEVKTRQASKPVPGLDIDRSIGGSAADGLDQQQLRAVLDRYYYSRIDDEIRTESPVIVKAVNFLKDVRFPEGCWSQTPWVTAKAIRALLTAGEDPGSSFVTQATKWLLKKQMSDGSWSQQLWDTAHVIRALVQFRSSLSLRPSDLVAQMAAEAGEAIKKAVTYVYLQSGWNTELKQWGERRWGYSSGMTLPHVAHSYDVATSIAALIEAGEMDRAFFLESTDHLIGTLGGKVREGERELSHWDHNVLNTAIAVEAILSVIRMGFPGPKKVDYFRVILSSIDYIFSVQTPGFGGWGDTRHTGRVVYALAMLIKQVETDVELQEEFQTPKEGIAQRMHMGLMDLAETQMPNGSWYGRDEATSTGIIAFIYSGEEKPFSEVQISLPAASFQALVDALRGTIQEYAWELYELTERDKRSPEFREMKKELESMKNDLAELKVSRHRLKWVVQILLVIAAVLLLAASNLAARQGIIPAQYADSLNVMNAVTIVVGYVVIFLVAIKK